VRALLERNPWDRAGWPDEDADACRRQLRRGDDDVAEAGERFPW
jgi:hypothetical protein